MISTHLPYEVYELADEHHLGEPIRTYKVKPMQWRTLGYSIILLYVIVMFVPLIQIIIQLIQNGFKSNWSDFIIPGIFLLLMVSIVALIAFNDNRRAREAAVYICAAGFIARDKRTIDVVRWEEVEWPAICESKPAHIVHLVNRPDLTLNKQIDLLELLSTEIELKAQLARYPERGLDLERRFEQLQIEREARKEAAKLLYQTQEEYLTTKDPEEAFKLGAEYQLEETVGTYRAGSHGLFQRKTLLDIGWSCFIIVLLIDDPQRGIKPFWPLGCLISIALFGMFFILPRFSSRHTRLHIYTKGIILIQPASFDLIHWEQVKKGVYAKGLFSNFCTLHLKDGEKLTLNDCLEKQWEIKQLLSNKLAIEELSPRNKPKDGYIDIGHLAD